MSTNCSNYSAQHLAEHLAVLPSSVEHQLSASLEHKWFLNAFYQLQTVAGTSADNIATLGNTIPAVLPSAASTAVPSVLPSAASAAVKPSIKKKYKKRKICCHGKQAHICKDCGGKDICNHGVQKNQCKRCGGKGICEHGRVRWQCPDCGGASMCVHRKRKARCIDCGGNAICIHRKVKYNCRECKELSAEKQAATILAQGEQTPRLFALVSAACPDSVVQTRQ